MREQHGFDYSQRAARRAGQGGSQRGGPPPANPHRAGFHAGLHPEDAPYRTDEDELDEDAYEPRRTHTSVRRFDQPGLPARYVLYPQQTLRIPARRTAHTAAYPPQETYDDLPTAARSNRRSMQLHWLVYAGLGAMLALLLWLGGSWLGGWWSSTQDDWTYTQAFRTYSVDQVVGHNHDSEAHPSHFLVQNDHGRVLLIELPADDPSKLVTYAGPLLLGAGQDRIPITISFQLDMQTGRLDLVLHIQGQSYVFVNTGTKFVPPTGH